MEKIELRKDLTKEQVVELVDEWRKKMGLEAEEINTDKPWGAYWKIEKKNLEQFLELFFGEVMTGNRTLDLSPKFLLVGPGKQLSWQYHDRRAEEWKVVSGEVAVELSETDDEPKEGRNYKEGELIDLKRGIRHRLIGEGGWGLVAEIWVHTDPSNPSNEEDIVRLADEYGRESEKKPLG